MGNRKSLKHIKSSKRLKRRVIGNKKIIFAYVLILAGSILIALAALSALSFGKVKYLNPLASFILQKKSNEVQVTLEKYNIPYSKISAESDSTSVVEIKDNGKVYLSTKKDLIQQISSLQLVLSKLTIEGKRFKNLDFRFDKPVINF